MILAAAGANPVAAGPAQTADSIAGSGFVLHFPSGERPRAERLAAIAARGVHLPGLPEGLPTGIRIDLAFGDRAFDSLTSGQAPEWSAGVAIPSQRRIVLRLGGEGGRPPFGPERTLRHELAHLALHEHLGTLRLPRWFNEGYATFTSRAVADDDAWRLRVALAFESLPSFDSLRLGWPVSRAPAELAYLLSASAVEYLYSVGGERGFALLFERWKEEEDFEEALRRTYLLTEGQLEERWQEYVEARYGWLYVLGRSSVLWGVAALVLVLLFLIRRRRRRVGYARLRASEPFEEVTRSDVAPPPGGGEARTVS